MGAEGLVLDWATYAAARHACERWHYSGSVPMPPLVRIGAWEDGSFCGVVLFGRGAAPDLLRRYGLAQTEGAELVRVALREHRAPVSRIISIAVRMLRRRCPGLRLLLSFADPTRGHIGAVYQAAGWLYTGTTEPAIYYRSPDGRLWHPRMVSADGLKWVLGQRQRVWRYSECERVPMPGKHRYLLPLDAEMRERVLPLARPYPRRRSVESDAPADQAGEGGASPTRRLQSPFREAAVGGGRPTAILPGPSHAVAAGREAEWRS